MLWTELCTLRNSCVEALNLTVTVVGKKAFKEAIKVK